MVFRYSTYVRPGVWVVVVAGLTIGVASHPATFERAVDPLRDLVRVTAPAHRDFAPRLSGGFAWAPLAAGNREEDSTSSQRLAWKAATAGLVYGAGAQPSPRGRHVVALRDLLLGDARTAADKLEALTRERPSAATWNDLAAALFVIATREADPSRLAKALAAADAALHLDEAFAEARFNRALILESLGLRDQSRDEWEACARIDPGSGWALEARQHAASLTPEVPFPEIFAQRYDQLLAHPGDAWTLVRMDLQEARVAGQEVVLARWGEAILAADNAQAAKHLALAREIGAELVRSGGDEMVAALVGAIEHADSAQRMFLAQAHVHFHAGREFYRIRDLQAAERSLTASADEFARGNSPGALMARAFTANTIYEELRVAEASGRLKDVLTAAGPRFPALRAGVLWQMGGVAFAASRWGESLEAFRESLSIYQRLGERNYAATLSGLLAYVYARVGDPDQAWTHRAMALRELGRTPSFRLHQAIDAVTQTALADDDWPVAISFLGLDIDLAKRMKNAPITIEAHLTRAELRIRLQERLAAETDLREAKRTIALVQDPADRRHYDANAKAVEATLTSSPATAVALLTEAIDFHSTVGRRMHLPWLFMLRGRARHALASDELAAKDFEAGISELESHRTSLVSGEDRWGIFHAADDLFASAVMLALEQDDVPRAFEYVERERARGLLDTLETSWRRVAPSDVPEGVVVVEYAAHEKDLVIFVLGARGVRAVRRGTTRETLRLEIAALDRAIVVSDGEGIRRSGRRLHHLLIEPVEQDLATAKLLAFVPDPRLGNLPFAVLRDAGGKALVARYAITIEPSAAVFTRLHKPTLRTLDRRLLIVTGSSDALGALTFANAERRGVAAQYKEVRQLSRDGATTATFEREVAEADVLHFVGHGVVANGARESAYLVLGGGQNTDRHLSARQIAALRLPRTSLVVLAACATGAGQTRSTEGTISVARAFLVAGVPSIAATLWSIDDKEAAKFFPRFHHHVASGLTPAEALRQTQLEWIERGDGSTSMWTSVQIIGK